MTFLGTASAQPGQYRNVSGIYVDLFARGSLLVDCGEDSVGQLKRRCGWHGVHCTMPVTASAESLRNVSSAVRVT